MNSKAQIQKKTYLLISVVVLAILLAIALYWYVKANPPAAATYAYPAVKVALAKVESREAPRRLSAVGELEAVRQIQVASEVAGRVEKIYFQSGQYVQAGQLLLQLNDDVEQGEIAQLKAKLKLNETVYQRSRELLQVNAVSKEEVDNALSNRDVTLGQMSQLNAKIRQKAIRAPFSGSIGIRKVHQGQYINIGEAIVSLVDTQNLLVNFNLDERIAPQIVQGQSLHVALDAFPDQIFTAHVSAIDPLISSSRTIHVQAQLPNAQQRFKAGMFASVIIQQQAPGQATTALMIPETAVTYSAYGETVFVAVQDKDQLLAKKVAVKVGERAEGWVEISSGLQLGDRVVTSGQLKLSDAMPIEALATDTLAATAPVVPQGAAQQESK
ncbi:multidrug efflux system membrane fusion protein [Acinetobacter calcoaceticus]|uniref:Multidrug efflux system membrane fusion protein n=1 Tax=Acinetobacter calcoaceticus TaxID=471 RepID=A0A4R1XNH5_ACICA|nr:multidrug efflux system membrane fusion protein [Acinetobacter calcoaceticus]